MINSDSTSTGTVLRWGEELRRGCGRLAPGDGLLRGFGDISGNERDDGRGADAGDQCLERIAARQIGVVRVVVVHGNLEVDRTASSILSCYLWAVKLPGTACWRTWLRSLRERMITCEPSRFA
jgi:hypothetical protein